MKQKAAIFIVLLLMSFTFFACTTELQNDQSTEVSDELLNNQTPVDNSIDRAFSQVLDERGDELKDNATFTYLYALEWYEEFRFFIGETFDVGKSETSWESYMFNYQFKEAGIDYAEKYNVGI